MFAIIKTGGKQYIVRAGDKIKVEKLDAPEGSGVVFVALLVSDKETVLGTPHVNGYNIKAKVLRHGKGEKIIVYKYKPKKRYHKKQGHRQLFTEVEILSIGKETVTAAKPEGEVKVAKKRPSPKKSTAIAAKKKVPTATNKTAKRKASTKAK